ncbi:protein-cysteine N-palmitoyltransferase HHAT-like protein [Neolamprologus brichardi]|uniref:protein-cysteine N-palmitoyltransferase HHAT-like protein n=1 Tax=Neolamprologus brichardi TaxID=32507 RepID=UPI0016437CA8|nr:protein-cysteine N-palmitoyltransferase HHAT-like protein [Neolamprologus brichardi]
MDTVWTTPHCENANRKSFKESVKPGWHYFGRKMDAADFEWVMWFTTFRNHILFALVGHVIFAKIFSLVAPKIGINGCKHRSLVFGVYGGLAVLVTMGWTFLALVLSHCIILYSVAIFKSKWMCFAAGLCTLASIKLEPFNSWQEALVTGSFNLTQLIRKEREMWNITIKALLHLGGILVVDVFFHYLYILTIPSDMKLVAKLSDWSLAGLAYSNLVYDWVKAAVMFGVINTVAMLDHLDPPQPPKCITMLYVFAETHFDRGINDWLCKYVYDYIGGNHDQIFKELLATICTFAVTTLWLGPCELVYIWSFFNCFGLNFELWVAKLFSFPPLSTIEVRNDKANSKAPRHV